MKNEHSLHLGQEKLYLWHFRKIGWDEILTNSIFFNTNGKKIYILYNSNEYTCIWDPVTSVVIQISIKIYYL